MLFLRFQIGEQPHAIDVTQIETVVPALALRSIPGAPRGVVGVFEHHGRMVPVVDLSLAVTGQVSRPFLSTRFILVKTGVRLLGLLAEQVTEIVEVSKEALQPSGIKSSAAPFLGDVFRDEIGSIVQCVTPASVLPPDVLASLELEPTPTS